MASSAGAHPGCALAHQKKWAAAGRYGSFLRGNSTQQLGSLCPSEPHGDTCPCAPCSESGPAASCWEAGLELLCGFPLFQSLHLGPLVFQFKKDISLLIKCCVFHSVSELLTAAKINLSVNLPHSLVWQLFLWHWGLCFQGATVLLVAVVPCSDLLS